MSDSILLRRWLPAVRSFIELCGRHPLVTGALALFGVGFSFFTFGLDRVESAKDELAKQQLATTVDVVKTRVEALASEAGEKPQKDPINSAFNQGAVARGIDNVSFSTPYDGASMPSILKNSKGSFTNLPYLQFSIKSVANREFVQIAPYLIIDVISVSIVPEKLTALYEPGRGGGAELRSFSAALKAKTGYQYAVLVDEMSGEIRNDIDYFRLQPREPEEFFLSLSYEPGFIFTYKVGLHYRFEGYDSIHWVTGLLRSGIPDRPLPVAILDGAEGEITFKTQLHPDAEVADAARLSEDAQRFQSAASRGKVFNPKQLQAYRASLH